MEQLTKMPLKDFMTCGVEVGVNLLVGKKNECVMHVCTVTPNISDDTTLVMNNTDWKLLLSSHEPINFPYWGRQLIVPPTVRDDIFNQLSALVGQQRVYFVPRLGEDRNRFNEYPPIKINSEYGGCNIVGEIIDVKKNALNYISPVDDIFAKIQVFDKYDWVEWNSYGLHIGMDDSFNRFEDQELNPYPKSFTLKSCKVKGLYLIGLENPNIAWDHLSDYYSLRGIGMYMYFPGRCYL